MLNSVQHARSAASRLDDVIVDRSALEQAREGLGGRDIESHSLDQQSKRALLWVTAVRQPRNSAVMAVKLVRIVSLRIRIERI